MKLNQLSECVEAGGSALKKSCNLFSSGGLGGGVARKLPSSCKGLWKMLSDLHRKRIIFEVEIEKLRTPPPSLPTLPLLKSLSRRGENTNLFSNSSKLEFIKS